LKVFYEEDSSMRYTPMGCTLMRCTLMRCTPVRYTLKTSIQVGDSEVEEE
jgi:hypothetical protein